MSSSLIATTAISTAVATVVGAAFKWGGGLVARLRRRLSPDHRPLHAGEWSLTGTYSGGQAFRVFVACAPNHSLKQDEVDPDRAIELVRRSFDEYANSEPQRSLPHSGVQFRDGPIAVEQPYVWVWRCGRLDYSTFVTARPTPDGGRALSVEEILRPILTMARAVASREYTSTFPRRSLRRRRFDWFIAVSTDVRSEDHSSLPWTELTFPGHTPKRAGDRLTYCPPQGYGAGRLINWSTRESRTRIVATFLDSFLKENGYHDCSAAIEATCTAVGAAS